MKTIIHKPNNKKKLRAYIHSQRRRGKLIEFGKYIFDAESLFEVRYDCDPIHCLREVKGEHFGSCCTDYAVNLEEYEKKRLLSIIKKGKKICAEKYPWVLSEKLFRRDRNGPFIKHRVNNTCAFSVVKEGRILCVVDLLVKEFKLSRKYYKPSICYSWPFDCVRTEDGRMYVYVINKKNGKHLVQATGELKCVSGKMGRPASESLKEQLEAYLGKKVYEKLCKAAKNGG